MNCFVVWAGAWKLSQCKKNKEGYLCIREVKEQRMEEFTIKGSDLKSITDSFILKMSSLSSAMSPVSGFDMKI